MENLTREEMKNCMARPVKCSKDENPSMLDALVGIIGIIGTIIGLIILGG